MPQPPTTMTATQRYVARVLANNARRAAERTAPTAPLDAALSAWWGSLPTVTRHRRYALVEIVDALYLRTGHRFAARHVSGALQTVGWTRSRSWRKADCDRRFFMPPSP